MSELRKVRSGKANQGVAEWAAQVPATALFVSVITIQELEHGVLLMERSDSKQGALLRAWLDQSVTAAFKSRVLAVDERVARRAAGLHVPDPAPFRDALVGAICPLAANCWRCRRLTVSGRRHRSSGRPLPLIADTPMSASVVWRSQPVCSGGRQPRSRHSTGLKRVTDR